MDELTKEIKDELPWFMSFADDIVLIDEIREGVNSKLERSRHTLESRGFRVSRFKPEYLHSVLAGGKVREKISPLRGAIPKVEKFGYLGSVVQQSGKIDEYIN